MDETENNETPGEIRPDPAESVATTSVSPETGLMSLTWSGEKPQQVIISVELLENWVEAMNDLTAHSATLNEALEGALAAITGLQEQVDKQQAVLTMVRMGRRPNMRDWVSVGLVKAPRKEGSPNPDVRMAPDCPECRSGKCGNCVQSTLDYHDRLVDCPCQVRGHVAVTA